MRAFDMSRFERVIAVESERISGSFVVLGGDRLKETWVTAHDVVIWDEGHNSGRVFHSDDLKGSVRDGKANLSRRMVASDRLADVEEVWDEMLAILVAVVDEFWAKQSQSDLAFV
jgi:hypothetical protein